MLEVLGQDVRHGLRLLRRSPGLAFVTVVTLGVAIGASVTTFSVLNAVFLEDLPFREPERVVFLRHDYATMAAAFSPPTFVDFRKETRAFESMSASVPWNVTLTGTGEPERLRGLLVSADFFHTLGAGAWRGRTFRPDEERPGAERVVVVSHGLWQRRFGGDPAIVGSTVSLDGQPCTVVGILPPGFRWGRGWGRAALGDVWAPYVLTPQRVAESQRGNERLDVYARLRPGVDLRRAQADLDRVSAGIRARFPDRYTAVSGWHVRAVGLQETMVGGLRPALTLVAAAVGCLLLLAAINVAGLLLARQVGRRGELALRAALGAGRGRLVRHALAEGAAVAGAGAVLGLALARLAVTVLERVDRVSLPRAQPIELDARVVLFGLLAALLVALVSGLVPAWPGTRSSLAPGLSGGARALGSHESRRARRALVVAQAAAALALVVGAGLLVRSLAALVGVPQGFRGDEVLAVPIRLPPARYAAPVARVAAQRDLLERLAGQPGVRAAGLVSELPLSGDGNSSSFEIEGRPVPPEQKQPHAETWSASPGYLAALGIPLRRGHVFDVRDTSDTTPVALVSETLAERWFPGEDPIGRRIDFQGNAENPQWREIVGVVGDVRDRGLDRDPAPQIYVPYAQRPTYGFWAVLHTEAPPLASLPMLRAAIARIDPDLPVQGATTMEQLVARDTRERQVAMAALTAFAAAALLLSALGLYGLVAQTVRERVPEVGLRMALGAGRVRVTGMFLAEGARLVAVGMACGLLVAVGSGRLVRGLLFGVSAVDPLTYAAAGLVLLTTALAACAVPASRAARVDPARALRTE
jgi:predicted permease